MIEEPPFGRHLETLDNLRLRGVAFGGAASSIVGFGWLGVRGNDGISCAVAYAFGIAWCYAFLRMRRIRIEVYEAGIAVWNYFATKNLGFDHWVACAPGFGGMRIRTDDDEITTAAGFARPSWGPHLDRPSDADLVALRLNHRAAEWRASR